VAIGQQRNAIPKRGFRGGLELSAVITSCFQGRTGEQEGQMGERGRAALTISAVLAWLFGHRPLTYLAYEQ